MTTLALEQLGKIPGITIYGGVVRPRVGVISFNIEGMPHGLVAGILSQEWGIGTRSGCFCAHAYLRHLLRLDQSWSDPARLNSGEPMPGAVRVSFGVYNTRDEVLRSITEGHHASGYRYDPDHGEYSHPEAACDFGEYFRH